eukprot:833160_1
MAVAYFLWLNILFIINICIASNISLLTRFDFLCNTKLNLNDVIKNNMHSVLLSIFNESYLHNTNQIYSTKLCPLHINSKYYISIDYNSLCVYISVDINIIWKQCKSNTQIQNTM